MLKLSIKSGLLISKKLYNFTVSIKKFHFTAILLILGLSFSILDSNAQDLSENLYSETLQLYKNLAADSKKVRDKKIWEIIAIAFYSIYKNSPKAKKAPDSLFISAKMYEEMGERFKSQDDLDRSVEYSRLFIRKYPDNSLADDAQLRVARIIEKRSKPGAYIEYKKIVSDFQNADMKPIAEHKIQELTPFKPSKRHGDAKPSPRSKSRLTSVNKIRHWSTNNFTRVVIHLDKEATFYPKLLKPDPSIGKPLRLFVDINDTRVNDDMYVEPITKGLLEQIKFARNTHNKVRVVLYIKSFDNYKVFALQEPFRIVMDIHGDEKMLLSKSNGQNAYKYPPKLPQDKVSSLSKALGLKIKTVVIDPGHGGHDPGAIGPSGLKEKDINLKIAKALKKKLDRDRKNLGIEKIYLTRNSDKFIPLEERTGIAKKLGADLFISIHCNAARDKKASGIETYVLSFTDDQRSLAVAARENASTRISRSDLKNVLQKYLLSAKIDESERFAGYVQNSLVNEVSRRYKPVQNKGVKKAPFIVLIGADIPSILVETSFISNPRDEKRLKNTDYIDRLAEGIFTGIEQYSSELQTASIQ